MASARELLEQADALMRKNRSRGDNDIPLLTDAVAIVPAAAASIPVLVAVTPHEDVPLLTDAVEEVVVGFPPEVVVDFPPSLDRLPALGALMEGDPSDWLVMDTIDPASHSITGRAPDTLAVVPPITLKAAGSDVTPPPLGSQPLELVPPELPKQPASSQPAVTADAEATVDAEATGDAPAARAFPAADQELWRALAEQISMQVLQRLDLFTDTGLKEQLAQRLEPIVERASAELVRAITEHVGLLLRTYVSGAIEREIAQWKRDQH